MPGLSNSVKSGMSSNPVYRLLVADINHHVRELLRRELEREGFCVSCAGSANAVLTILEKEHDIDVLVIDPEMLSLYGYSAFVRLQRCSSRIAVIMLTYKELFVDLGDKNTFHFVEKDASSIAPLKEMIWRCLLSMKNPS